MNLQSNTRGYLRQVDPRNGKTYHLTTDHLAELRERKLLNALGLAWLYPPSGELLNAIRDPDWRGR